MWAWILERCADLFGVTRRGGSPAIVALTVLASLPLVAALLARWGLRGALPVVVLVALAALAAREATVARDRLWRAATLPLDDAAQRPQAAVDAGAAATAMALNRLAIAVDATRRGRYVEAGDLVAVLSRELLRPEELRLLDAVRAMIALGLGDTHRGAQLAVVALPTGSEELDTWLGRALVSDAWGDMARLSSIDSAWSRAGVEPSHDGSLPKLRRLVRIHIEGAELDQMGPREAQELSDEARAIGDDDLAVQLDAVGRRTGTYR